MIGWVLYTREKKNLAKLKKAFFSFLIVSKQNLSYYMYLVDIQVNINWNMIFDWFESIDASSNRKVVLLAFNKFSERKLYS